MNRILVIKTGAAGDIVRTTSLLQVLTGHITWVVDNKYREILPSAHPSLQRILAIEDAFKILQHEHFDLTLSLEEDFACARLATQVKTRQMVGVYLSGDTITYTNSAAGWYDMSLISKYGAQEANARKAANTHTFQYWLFNMLSLSFSGERYCIYSNPAITPQPNLVGIETRSGDRWPNKSWTGYTDLAALLTNEGYLVRILSQRATLREYMDDIAACASLVSGDTLAMHLAMAYQVPSVALFNCTSPQEIYDYGVLDKVINPMWKQAFYGREYSPGIVSQIAPEEVYTSLVKQLAKDTRSLTQNA